MDYAYGHNPRDYAYGNKYRPAFGGCAAVDGRRLAAPPLLTAGVWRLRRVGTILLGGLVPKKP